MRPDLLVGSPMCGPYSKLQILNRKTPEAEKSLEEKQKQGDEHLEFCARQYEAQMERGGFFLHEHPRDATSWERPCMKRLREKEGVYLVTADLCRYGLTSRDEHGSGFSKKPTFFLTNSEEIANELSLRCSNDCHVLHIRLLVSGETFRTGPRGQVDRNTKVQQGVRLFGEFFLT